MSERDEKSPKKPKTTCVDERGGTNPHTGLALSDRYYDILSKRKTLPVWLQKEEFAARRPDAPCAAAGIPVGSRGPRDGFEAPHPKPRAPKSTEPRKP